MAPDRPLVKRLQKTMTNIEFIKLLLISVGCDRKYEIDTHRAGDGLTFYDVYGEGDNEERNISLSGYGVYDVVLDFLYQIRKHPDVRLLDNLNYDVNHLPLKYLLDDNERRVFYEQQKKAMEETLRYLEDTKFITEWCETHNPCRDCSINKKDHWDDIHYNCAENHYHRCPILLEYCKKRDDMYEEYRKSLTDDSNI